MTGPERRRHELEARAYAANCTNAQLRGVVVAEAARIRRFGEGDVADVARIMRRAARDEAGRRGVDLDA